jgi:lysophospholipase L1-like esterase
MQEKMPIGTDFKETYPNSIAITHSDYVMERCGKRKLFIYGTGAEAVNLAKYLYLIYKIDVQRFIDDECAGGKLEGKEIITSIDVVYEEKDKIFVIIANENESYGISRKKFIDMGLIEDLDFTYHSEIPSIKEPLCFDVTLSYNRIKEKIEGFELFGDTDNPNAIKIVALGGSTTESTLCFIKGWVQFLAELFQEKNIPAVIYGGGVSGYNSCQELLKLIRDVIPLKPDIVLSYSGVNDLYYYINIQELERLRRPFITKFQIIFVKQILEKLSALKHGLPVTYGLIWDKIGQNTVFYGLENDKSTSEVWLDNMRMMRITTKEFGIQFFSFFQPFRFNGFYERTDIQDIIHNRRDLSCIPESNGYEIWGRPIMEEMRKITSEIKKYNYIFDFSGIFTNYQGIYLDAMHVYEQGNRIIAEKIFDALTPYLGSTEK